MALGSMPKFADLHIHTHYSDSTSSPQEVVEQSLAAGLSCIAITDHDTIDGIRPIMEIASQHDLEIISGLELSTEMNGKDIHILGYGFDYENREFQDQLKKMQDVRVERMEEMIVKLKKFGIDNIQLEEVCSLAKSQAVGRPHLARVLIEKGWVSNYRAAFDKYLAEGAAAYVPKFKQTPFEAIQLIKKVGGIAVLAHPMITSVDELIPGFAREGLEGLEVYYSNTTDTFIEFYEGIARKNSLLLTGGSDAHGQAKRHTYVGRRNIPYELVEKMKERIMKRM